MSSVIAIIMAILHLLCYCVVSLSFGMFITVLIIVIWFENDGPEGHGVCWITTSLIVLISLLCFFRIL